MTAGRPTEAEIRAVLRETYTEQGTEIWLMSRSRGLMRNGRARTPRTAIRQGDAQAVMDLARGLAAGLMG